VTVVFFKQMNNSYGMEQLGFKIVEFRLWYISWENSKVYYLMSLRWKGIVGWLVFYGA